LRVGVIGAGAIARRAHLPALANIKDIELVGIADKVSRRAERLARRFKIGKAYGDYLRLLDEGLNFAVLCTPSNLHGIMIADCAARGVNVLTEKPLAHDFETSLGALKKAKQSGVKVCVVQNYRYCPVMWQAKRIVDSGRLGTVLTVIIVAHTPSPMQWTHSNWLYRAGGVLDDFGPHAYDLMAWFANSNPEIVYAWGSDATQGMNLVNYAHISVGFANRVHAATDLSWFSGSRKFSLDIHGTGGRLHVDVTTDSLEEIHGFATPISDLKSSWSRAVHTIREAAFGRLLMGGLAYYDRVYDDFLQFLKNSGPAPVSSLDSLRAVQIMDYSRRSVSEKKAIVVPKIEEFL
jgi:predicted dehydrogenase